MAAKKADRKRQVVIVAMPNTMLLNVAGTFDVFSHANVFIEEKYGLSEGYKVVVVSRDSSDVTMGRSNVGLYSRQRLENIEGKIDTLLITGHPALSVWKKKAEFVQWLKKTAKKTRRIGSVCRGAFLLAEAGLLKGKRATTHWKFCKDLQLQFPEIMVEGAPIYIKDGNVYTSAGVSAGIDLALALVEEDYGREVALNVARDLVLYLRRPGNQSQFSRILSQQEAEHEPIRELQSWLLDHLQEPLSVEQLAEQCSMSPRNFSRVFQKEMGVTPGKYLEKLRVETARQLLEESSLSIEQIAGECGLGSADTMRRLFLRHLKSTPSEYKRSFRTSLESQLHN